MSDRAALLATICANPDDDTPRLLFADWLDENEPDAKPRVRKKATVSPSPWAGLIRAECEFERLKHDGSPAEAVFNFFGQNDEQTFKAVRWERVLPEVARLVELSRLIPTLRNASAKARNAGRPKAGRSHWWFNGTNRGFPSGINVYDGSKLAERIEVLSSFCPALELNFTFEPRTNVSALVTAGISRWCCNLTVSAIPSHADLIAAMSHSPDTVGVHKLTCERNDGDELPRMLTAIAESPHWAGLHQLRFEAFDSIPAEVFRVPHLRGLRRLSLHECEHVSNVVAALGSLIELRHLSLTASNLDDTDAERLARMPNLAKLRWLDLTNNSITGRGASALLTSPYLKNLTVLDIALNPVRGLDRNALANAPVGQLRVLCLQSCRLHATDIATITSCPLASKLLYFAVCGNDFPESAIARLVKGFGNYAPAVLYLIDSNITTAGAQALANWPAASQIDMLHLKNNILSVHGARALANCPHLQHLNHICASVGRAPAETILKNQFGKRALV